VLFTSHVLTINSSKIKCFIACGNPRALNLIGIGGVPAWLAPLQQALIYDMACGKSPIIVCLREPLRGSPQPINSSILNTSSLSAGLKLGDTLTALVVKLPRGHAWPVLLLSSSTTATHPPHCVDAVESIWCLPAVCRYPHCPQVD
jgi:hypothetical protein